MAKNTKTQNRPLSCLVLAGAGGNNFAKGKNLINKAGDLLGNAYKKGVHPVVKKAAKKTLNEAKKYIKRSYIGGQIESIAYLGLSNFSSWYILETVKIVKGK